MTGAHDDPEPWVCDRCGELTIDAVNHRDRSISSICPVHPLYGPVPVSGYVGTTPPVSARLRGLQAPIRTLRGATTAHHRTTGANASANTGGTFDRPNTTTGGTT